MRVDSKLLHSTVYPGLVSSDPGLIKAGFVLVSVLWLSLDGGESPVCKVAACTVPCDTETEKQV